LEELGRTADLVVVGVVGEVVLRKVEETTGLPFTYLEFSVSQVLGEQPTALTLDNLIVSTIDTDELIVDSLSPLVAGQRVLLFMERIRAADAPEGLVPFDEIFVPLSHDNGVFDVTDRGEVTARSDIVVSTTTAGVKSALEGRPPPEVSASGEENSSAPKLRFSLETLESVISPRP
jgi:hypothetical protein